VEEEVEVDGRKVSKVVQKGTPLSFWQLASMYSVYDRFFPVWTSTPDGAEGKSYYDAFINARKALNAFILNPELNKNELQKPIDIELQAAITWATKTRPETKYAKAIRVVLQGEADDKELQLVAKDFPGHRIPPSGQGDGKSSDDERTGQAVLTGGEGTVVTQEF